MKTEDEIVERVRMVLKRPALFEFVTDVLVDYLPWEKAKEFLDESAMERKCGCGVKSPSTGDPFCSKCGQKIPSVGETWDKERKPLTREFVLKEMREYIPFGLEKASGRRGVSAQRTVHKIDAWVWLLNEGEAKDIFEDIPLQDYGRGLLIAVCERYGFPTPAKTHLYAQEDSDD